ncbi:MAG: hypothetical protein IPK52_13900 [Chloroflexi bacterium]|nr:hypothetical protein [Chloroflexota bacterium]
MTAAVDLNYNPEQPNRLAQVGWGGTLNAYIVTTSSMAVRPASATGLARWSAGATAPAARSVTTRFRMSPTTSRTGIRVVTDAEDLLSVKQFPIIPGEGGGEASAEAVGGDVDTAFAAVSALVGDPVRGQALYENKERSQRANRLGCSGCHYGGLQGPTYDGIWPRILDEVATNAAPAGYTPEYYVVESILASGNFVVEGWNAGVMPGDFGQRMSAQDVADILEFIKASDPSYIPPVQPEPATEATATP